MMQYINKIWPYIDGGWRPALEILILAVLIYYVFRFLRGTRGWPVVIGFVVVLLALTLVTTVLDLKVLRWMLGSASVFIAVGALVIFQPELRCSISLRRKCLQFGPRPTATSLCLRRPNPRRRADEGIHRLAPCPTLRPRQQD